MHTFVLKGMQIITFTNSFCFTFYLFISQIFIHFCTLICHHLGANANYITYNYIVSQMSILAVYSSSCLLFALFIPYILFILYLYLIRFITLIMDVENYKLYHFRDELHTHKVCYAYSFYSMYYIPQIKYD